MPHTLSFPLATADEMLVLRRMRATLAPDVARSACGLLPDVMGHVRLLRFLQGFDHDEKKALAAVRKMIDLRRKYGLDLVHEKWALVPCTHTSGFPHQQTVTMHMASITTLGFSVDGHPICYSAISRQDNRACLSSIGDEGYLEFYCAQCESRMAQLHALSVERQSLVSSPQDLLRARAQVAPPPR